MDFSFWHNILIISIMGKHKELWDGMGIVYLATNDIYQKENTYKVGITLDGLIKNAYIIEDDCLTIIRPSELPKEVYQNISSYYSDKWIDIIKAVA